MDLLLLPAPSFAGGKPENRIPRGFFDELGRQGGKQANLVKLEGRLALVSPGQDFWCDSKCWYRVAQMGSL